MDIVARRGSFEPLLVQRTDGLASLRARNKACFVGSKSPPTEGEIERAVVTEDVEGVVELPDVPLRLEREGKVACQNLYELLPDGASEPGRYRFEATVSAPKRPESKEELRFSVERKEADPDRPSR